MSYIVYAKGLSAKYKPFTDEMLSNLARKGVNISNHRDIENGQAMTVQYTDETGDMTIVPEGDNIRVAYTASGGPETLKGTVTGGAAGLGIGVLTGVLTGKANKDKMLAGVAGAISGGAIGAYKGHEKGQREKITFAKLLAFTITDTERHLLNLDKQVALAQARQAVTDKNKNMERIRLDSHLSQLKGQLESKEIEESSKKTAAESKHIERISELEEKYANKAETLQKLLASEDKRYESEIKMVEANYSRIKSNLSARIAETEAKLNL